MLLSEIVGKNVYSGKALRGVCRGVCLSLKSRAVKYLLCSSEPAQNDYTEFSVGIGCIGSVEDTVVLKRLRTAIPKNCVRFFTGRPVIRKRGNILESPPISSWKILPRRNSLRTREKSTPRPPSPPSATQSS